MLHSKRILMPIDEREHCERAFDWYLENYGHDKQEIILLHVYQSLDHVTQTTPSDSDEACDMPEVEMENIFKAARTQAQVFLEKYENKCNKIKVPYKIMVELGSPGGAICKVAKEEKITCIVLGNRGLGAFRRTMLGSVSDHVIHHSHVPVLLVPPRDHHS